MELGRSRMAALEILLEINNTMPAFYAAHFHLDTWWRMLGDYSCNIPEGVERLAPYVGETEASTVIRRIPLTDSGGRKTFWREPSEFRAESPKGFRRRSIIRELQMEKHRGCANQAFSRHLPKRLRETRNGGNEPAEGKIEGGQGKGSGGGAKIEPRKKDKAQKVSTKYHAGLRLAKAWGDLEVTNTPANQACRYICWGFSARPGCPRGSDCSNHHQIAKSTGV